MATIIAVGVLVTGVVFGTPTPSEAAPTTPWAWERTYVATGEAPETWDHDLFLACLEDQLSEIHDNGVTGVPTIAVVGDSVDSVIRGPALLDTAYRWVFGTHCGENYGTALQEGRVDHVLDQHPDVLMAGIASNNFSRNFAPVPELLPWFEVSFGAYLDRTDSVPCRVVFNLPHQYPAVQDDAQRKVWDGLADQANAFIASTDPGTHPNVNVVDWDVATRQHPEYLTGDGHLTHAGINARINLTIGASRRCFPPDPPRNPRAEAGNGTATVWWDPLPPEEAVTAYRVTASTGQTVTTRQATANVSGLADGIPVTFTVEAESPSGHSEASVPSDVVVPSALGARYHPLVAARALDTRFGIGGKHEAFGPQETFTLDVSGQLPPEAADASAVVLNVTADGPTAPSFVTVWPGGQSRPLTSSLNPRPGLAAIPALVTTRAGPGPTVQLYNNTGQVHLIVDVVGWYDRPADGTGALYRSMTPVRALDTRSGVGGKSTPFGARESYDLPLAPALPADASAAVLNITSTNATSTGFVTAHPTGGPLPLASNLNPQAGLTRANLTVAQLGADREVTLYNQSASTDLVVDLVGYYTALAAPEGGSEYFSITPERAYDSRDGTGGLVGPVGNASPTPLVFAGRESVPGAASVVGVDVNVTVTDAAIGGHVSLWPDGPVPDTSSLNFNRREAVSNRAFAALDAGRMFTWSSSSSVQYVVDVSGWFGPMIGAHGPAGARPDLPPRRAPSSSPPPSATILERPSAPSTRPSNPGR